MIQGKDLKELKDSIELNYNTIFNTKLSIKVAKLHQEIEKASEIYTEVLRKLILECAELKEDGSPVTDDKENIILLPSKINEWNKKFNDLQEEEFNFSINFTNDEIEQFRLTPAGAKVLLKLINEDPVI